MVLSLHLCRSHTSPCDLTTDGVVTVGSDFAHFDQLQMVSVAFFHIDADSIQSAFFINRVNGLGEHCVSLSRPSTRGTHGQRSTQLLEIKSQKINYAGRRWRWRT